MKHPVGVHRQRFTCLGGTASSWPQPECLLVCSIFEPQADHDDWVTAYRDQVAFVNSWLLELIDAVRARKEDRSSF